MKTTGIAVLLCILLVVFALPASAVQTDNTLILPADLTEIAPEAFLGLNSAEKVIVPATVTKIGSRAFAGCGTLSVMLPDDLEDIEPDVFEGGNAIALVRSGSKAKDACVSSNIPCLVYKTGTDQVTIEKCSGSVSSIAIPGEIEGLPVTEIGSSAFEDHADLESVLLPESVTTISNWAFGKCTKLKEINFPAALTSIGNDAFNRACVGPEETVRFYLPDNLNDCSRYVFSGSDAVLAVRRGSKAETLVRDFQRSFTHPGEEDYLFRFDSAKGEYLIRYSGTAETAVIPGGIWLIDVDAFKDHTELTNAVIPEGVTKINNRAFQGCTALTDVTFPESLEIIEAGAFSGCGKNAEEAFRYDLPDGITGIYGSRNDAAFRDCPAVLTCGMDSSTAKELSTRGYSFARNDRPEEMDFRYRYDYFDHVYGVGLYDYVGPDTQVRLPDDCANVNSEKFRDRTDLTLICAQLSDTAGGLSRAELNFTFPGHEDIRYRMIDGILYIMGYAGTGTEIVVPEAEDYIKAGVDEQIRRNAFSGQAAVTRIVIPEGVTRIESDAFANCYMLSDITLPSTLKALEQNVFLNVGRDAGTDPFYITLPDNMDTMAGNSGGAHTFTYCNAVLETGKTSQTAALLTDRSYVYTAQGEHDFRYRYVETEEGGEKVRRLHLVGYVGDDAEVTIPSGIYAVSRFRSNTTNTDYRLTYAWGFTDNTAISKLVIPEGTVLIEDSAFLGCVNLTDITFPQSLKILKNHAFEKCGSASETRHYYILPDQMEEISTNVGAGWGAFTNIGLGTLVCSADSETAKLLSNCYTGGYNGAYSFAPLGHQEDGLLYRYVRQGTEGNYTYPLYLWDYVGNATELIIPDDIGLYGVSRTPPGGSDSWKPAFYGNTRLEKVVIPEGVQRIEDSAFSGCTMLADITLPSTLKAIKNHAFENTGTSAGKRFIVVIPGGVTEFTGNNGAGWASFNGSAATLVATGVAAHELYEYWWVYYSTLEDAQAQVNLQFKDNDDPDFVYNGNI